MLDYDRRAAQIGVCRPVLPLTVWLSATCSVVQIGIKTVPILEGRERSLGKTGAVPGPKET